MYKKKKTPQCLFLIKSKIISIQFIGSLGSFNPIEYSDFDCVLILPNKTYFEDRFGFKNETNNENGNLKNYFGRYVI